MEICFEDARAQWADRLVSHYFVDVTRLCEALSAAIPSPPDLKRVSATSLEQLLTGGLTKHLPGGWFHLQSGHVYIGLPVFVRYYEDWAKSVGQLIGLETKGLDIGDEWADESLPEVRAVLWGLTDRLRVDLAAAKQVKDPFIAWRQYQIARQARANGESNHQIALRLGRASSELTLVR